MGYSVFFLVFVLFSVTLCASQVEKPKRCDVAYRCSSVKKPVWTTTNYTECEVFRNNCILLSVNCDRVNRDEPVAKEIPKDDCIKLCRKCPVGCSGSRICGYLDEEKRTFPSECAMKYHRCRTGETFELFRKGQCPATSV